MHAKMEVTFVVMQFTHVSGHNEAYSAKKLSSDKTVLLIWSSIFKKRLLFGPQMLVVLIIIFSIRDILLS